MSVPAVKAADMHVAGEDAEMRSLSACPGSLRMAAWIGAATFGPTLCK